MSCEAEALGIRLMGTKVVIPRRKNGKAYTEYMKFLDDLAKKGLICQKDWNRLKSDYDSESLDDETLDIFKSIVAKL